MFSSSEVYHIIFIRNIRGNQIFNWYYQNHTQYLVPDNISKVAKPSRKPTYSITSVPDHVNKRTTSRLGPLLSSPKVFPIDVMLKD